MSRLSIILSSLLAALALSCLCTGFHVVSVGSTMPSRPAQRFGVHVRPTSLWFSRSRHACISSLRAGDVSRLSALCPHSAFSTRARTDSRGLSSSSSRVSVHVTMSSSPSASESPVPDVDALLARLFITEPQSNIRSSKRKRVVLRFADPKPGLGDRLGGLLTLLVMAAFSNRTVQLDWTSPFPLQALLHVHSPVAMYDPTTPTPHQHICSGRTCRRGDLRPLLGPVHTVIYPFPPPMAHPRLIVRFARAFPQSSLSQMLLPHLSSVQSIHEASAFAALFRVFFQPVPAVTAALTKATARFPPRFAAVHARLGRGVGESGPRFALADRMGLAAAAMCFAERVAAAAGQGDVVDHAWDAVYLATDTMEFREEFERALSKTLPTARLLPSPKSFEPVHTARCLLPPGQSWTVDQERDCTHAMVEMLVLSRAHALVANPSSFSKVAALIGNLTQPDFVYLNKCKGSGS